MMDLKKKKIEDLILEFGLNLTQSYKTDMQRERYSPLINTIQIISLSNVGLE